jgi:hypothetical protein
MATACRWAAGSTDPAFRTATVGRVRERSEEVPSQGTDRIVSMLILAEGAIHHQVDGDAGKAVQAWFGAMADGGFLQSGYLDLPRNRLFLFLRVPAGLRPISGSTICRSFGLARLASRPAS